MVQRCRRGRRLMGMGVSMALVGRTALRTWRRSPAPQTDAQRARSIHTTSSTNRRTMVRPDAATPPCGVPHRSPAPQYAATAVSRCTPDSTGIAGGADLRPEAAASTDARGSGPPGQVRRWPGGIARRTRARVRARRCRRTWRHAESTSMRRRQPEPMVAIHDLGNRLSGV